MEGYCIKCRAMKKMRDVRKVSMKNGRKIIQGKCPDCGTRMFNLGMK